MRFWTYNSHGGRFLFDRSYMANLAELVGSDQSKLIDNTDDDGVSFTRNVNWFAGDQHIRVHDNPNIQIQNIHQTETGFTIFLRIWIPFLNNKALYGRAGVLFSKIDNEQVTFGYVAQVTENGDLRFIVKDNSREYAITALDALEVLIAGVPDFADSDFNSFDFFTAATALNMPDILPYDDIAFTYEFATHRMQIIKNGVIIKDTNTEPEGTGLVGWWRLVEGGDIGNDPDDPTEFDKTVYNSVETGNNGTISGNAVWSNELETHETYLKFDGTNSLVDVPTYGAIQNFTEFTVSLWYNPLSTPSASAFHFLFNLGWQTDGSFILYQNSSGHIVVEIRNDAAAKISASKTNAFPEFGKWYHIVVTWKAGEVANVYVDNVKAAGGATLSGALTVNAAVRIGDTTYTPDGRIHDVKIWNRKLSDAEVETDFEAGHPHAGFPPWVANPPPPPEIPEPITNPFVQVYHLAKPASNFAWQKLHKLVASGFSQIYSNADGVVIPEVSVPFSTVYEVTDSSGGLEGGDGGGGGTGSEIYNPTGDLEANHLEFEDGISRAGVRFDSDNAHLNKIVTSVTVKWRKTNSPGGTAFVGIRKNSDGSFVSLGSFSPGSFGDGEQATTINASSNTYQMQANDIVSVEYPPGSNTIELTYAVEGDVPGFTSLEYDGSWSTFNDGGSTVIDMIIVAATAGGGGGSGTGYPLWAESGHSGGSPDCNFGNWIESDISHVGAIITSSSADMHGEKLTRITVKLSKVGSPPGGVEVSVRDGDIGGSGVSKRVFGTVPASSITGTPQDFTFTDLDNSFTMGTSDAVTCWATTLGGDENNHFLVHASGSSQEAGANIRYRIWNKDKQCWPFGGTYSFVSNTSQDMTGKFEVGGTTKPSKDNFFALDGGAIRGVGERITDTSSDLYNEKVTRVKPKLQAVGNPTGTIRCVIRTSGGSEVSHVGSIEADTVSPTSFTEYEFTNLLQSRNLANGDRVMIEYIGTSSAHIRVMVEWDESHGGQLGNEQVTTLGSGGGFTDHDADMSGTIFVGGTASDPNAKERVGEKAETASSILKLKKISKALIWLRKVGNPPNDVFLRVRKQSDDSTVAVIGQIATSDITTAAAGTQKEFIKAPVSIYAVQENDSVLVEYPDGDDNNYVEVAITTTNQIDLANSILVKYDSLFTNYDIFPEGDLIATMHEGGDTFTPTGDEIPPPPPPAYTHDLHIYAGGYPYNYYIDETTIENWVGAISPDIRWYRKILTTNELTNIYENRRDRANIPKGQVAVIGFFSLPNTA